MKSKVVFPLIVVALLVAGLVGCRTCDTRSATPRPRHVVLVGIGCLGSAYVNDSARIPNIRRLMREGAWTMRKRSLLMPFMAVQSPVNWSAMFMAAGAEQTGCRQHGFTEPYSDDLMGFKPDFLLANGRFPDVYALCRAAEPSAKLGYVYPRKEYDAFVDTNICDFACWSRDPGRDGIAYLGRERPRAMSFILGSLEDRGKSSGWGSAEYLAELEAFDGTVGEILRTIESSGMADDSVVIVTSERGGVAKPTATPMTVELETPFVIWGKGVRRGHQLQSAVYSYDIGATMAALLGVRLPQVCTGRVIDEAFE